MATDGWAPQARCQKCGLESGASTGASLEPNFLEAQEQEAVQHGAASQGRQAMPVALALQCAGPSSTGERGCGDSHGKQLRKVTQAGSSSEAGMPALGSPIGWKVLISKELSAELCTKSPCALEGSQA